MPTSAPRLPRRVLIANRGEIAVRVARTCRQLGIATVAVFSDADADALHVEVCDEAVRIGGARAVDSYLRIDRIVEAALRCRADAVHPGYGFLSENAAFATAVAAAGLTWIGPPPDVIAAMGDKLEAKRRLAAADVPVLPGRELTSGLDDAEVAELAHEVGYPLLVKAAAGGGGKGMRLVADPAELNEAVSGARREAASAFGDDRVFLERFVQRPRHLEVQVLADAHGAVVHLFERECSIQRRHQKVVEETPSPAVDTEVREALTSAAVSAARAIGYVNAGTVEFVADDAVLARRRGGEEVDPREAFAFLEVNTRLQVEHPVTEATVRIAGDDGDGTLDLVRLQLLVAAGLPLPFAQADVRQAGHAIEARLYAEDPAHGHRPAPGPLLVFEPAAGDGIRWDVGVRGGDVVGPDYDPMLAKAIGWAPTRGEAAGRLAAALERTLLHATTNRDLLVAVLRDTAFLQGDTTTAFLAERFDPATRPLPAPDPAAVELAVAAAGLHALLTADSGALPRGVPAGFSNTRAFGQQLRVTAPGATAPRTVRIQPRDRDGGAWRIGVFDDVSPGVLQDDAAPASEQHVEVIEVGPDFLALEVEGHRRRLAVRWLTPAGAGEQAVRVALVDTARGWVGVTVLPRFPVAAAAEVAGATTAPMPGAVTRVAVAPGDRVARGDLLAVIEAMKMEHRITAAVAGEVAAVHVAPGEYVDADTVLVVVDAAPA
ncbi:biotin carboxylase N-terminal domain-containing protein [Egicoccus sp. AB-alg2]|uniref:acetyl/propionyl/methylcrotonyl-CoA carboxylase subunit alpha n=1 Tax=Egicoccus sp. AB-alg2 TaxID=3242693 RepID=UPI00359EEB03